MQTGNPPVLGALQLIHQLGEGAEAHGQGDSQAKKKKPLGAEQSKEYGLQCRKT